MKQKWKWIESESKSKNKSWKARTLLRQLKRTHLQKWKVKICWIIFLWVFSPGISAIRLWCLTQKSINFVTNIVGSHCFEHWYSYCEKHYVVETLLTHIMTNIDPRQLPRVIRVVTKIQAATFSQHWRFIEWAKLEYFISNFEKQNQDLKLCFII